MGAMDTLTADDGERLHLRIADNGIHVLFYIAGLPAMRYGIPCCQR